MSTDIKKNDKRDYVEKVMGMTDARFLSEAESFRFEKRSTPVSTWIAAACFALIFAAAAILLIKPLRERPEVIPANSSEPTASPTAAPAERLIFSEGNAFPDYSADVLENYDALVLEFPNGNPYFTGEASRALGAKLLLPKGWTVRNGLFDGLGYYPAEEFVSYCIASRPGNDIMSVYNEKGECVGSIGLAATSAEYPGLDQAFAVITMGEGAFRFNDEETARVGSGKNGEAYIGRARYAEKLADLENRRTLALPALISYDTEFLVGIVTEFGENAVTNEQLTRIAESVRFALLNAASGETPTPAPSQAPIPYNREEYDTLLAFFELKDSNGVKNGEKCFENYNPENVDFWGNEEHYEYNAWLTWDENGSLTFLWLDARNEPSAEPDGETTEAESILLTGELNLDGFDKLEIIHFYPFVFESLRINNCPALSEASICESTNETVLSGNIGSIAQLFIDSSGHCRYEHNGSKGIASEFTIVLTAQGQGKVIIDMYNGATTIGVYASPENGYEFIGWFDAEGNLISNVESFEISYNGETGSDISDFTGTARFASSDQSELVTDPWYFEKAWEYAELVNRLYGFNFQKDDWRASSRYHNRHIYFDTSENESDPIQLAVYFSDFEKEVRTAVLRSGSYGRPANYEDLSEEEWEALVYEVMPEAPVFTVTREMLEEAGYTLDGTSADYDKIAEFIAKSKAALLTGCSDNNPWRCIEAEVDYVSPVDGDTYFDDHPELHPFSYQLFVRPSHPHAFISCNRASYILAADDGAHPGWLLLDFNFTIADADGAWKCERPFS